MKHIMHLGATLAWLIACSFSITVAQDGLPDGGEGLTAVDGLLKQIVATPWATAQTSEITSLLAADVRKLETSLQGRSKADFVNAVQSRLERILRDVEQHEIDAYKSAYTEKRLLELMENVVGLRSRQLPSDEVLDRSLRQVDEILAEVKGAEVQAGNDKIFRTLSGGFVTGVDAVFERSVKSVFSPSYGRELKSVDKQFIRSCAEEVFGGLTKLSSTAVGGRLTAGLRGSAHKVIQVGLDKIRKQLETGGAVSAAANGVASAWVREHRALIDGVNGRLRAAEQSEVDAEIAAAEAESRRQQAEGQPDSPETVAFREAEEQRRIATHGPGNLPLPAVNDASQRTPPEVRSRGYWILLVNAVVVVVLMSNFVYRRRQGRSDA
jgi:hypothetical protein